MHVTLHCILAGATHQGPMCCACISVACLGDPPHLVYGCGCQAHQGHGVQDGLPLLLRQQRAGQVISWTEACLSQTAMLQSMPEGSP
jgi:hypothetical protein